MADPAIFSQVDLMKPKNVKAKNHVGVSLRTLLAKVASTKKLATAARAHLSLIKVEHKNARKAFKQAKKAAKIARKEAKTGAKLLKAKAKKGNAGPRTQALSKKHKVSKPITRATVPLSGLELKAETSLPAALATSMPVG